MRPSFGLSKSRSGSPHGGKQQTSGQISQDVLRWFRFGRRERFANGDICYAGRSRIGIIAGLFGKWREREV